MHTGTIPSKLIRITTNYKYTHVGISLEKDCNIIYSFGRKKLNSFLDSGFITERKNGDFFKKFDKTICKIYEINTSDNKYKKLCKIIENMENNRDIYKYDFFGLIPRFFEIPFTIKNQYVCSYFVAFVLKEAKIYKFKKNVCLIRPQDFDNLKGLKEVYTGMFSLYK